MAYVPELKSGFCMQGVCSDRNRELIGRYSKMRNCRNRIRRVAPKVVVLCLCGLFMVPTGCESGNGKILDKDRTTRGRHRRLSRTGHRQEHQRNSHRCRYRRGAGYLIGNQKDKNAAKTYDYNQKTPLTGTKWEVTSLVMDSKPSYESTIVEFQPNGEVVTTRNEPGGTNPTFAVRH